MAEAHPIPTGPRFINLTGKTFGKWIVISYSGKSKWLCRCECGTEKIVSSLNFKHGNSNDCGCTRIAGLLKRFTTHGSARKGKKTAEYRIWMGLKQRCTNRKQRCWPKYGGRGIKVCQRWLDSFENFLADVGPRPSNKHSIDRYPNNDGDYEPGNVRWATQKQQCRNTRRNRMLTFRGETLCMAEWAERLGVSQDVIECRINRNGWTVDEALSTPVKTSQSSRT